MSHLATWRGQPRVGIDHAVAAQGWAKETGNSLLRAYVADVAARAYATAGMQRSCLEALSSIPNNLDSTGHTPATSLVYFYGPGQYANTRAQCMLLLHDAPRAVQAAQESLTLINGTFVRNQAFSTLHLGNAYIESGEIEEAARVIGNGAELAARNRSARLVELLRQSRGRLDRWQGRLRSKRWTSTWRPTAGAAARPRRHQRTGRRRQGASACGRPCASPDARRTPGCRWRWAELRA